MSRRGLALGIAVVISLGCYGATGAARACSCMPPPPAQEAAEKSAAVFVGTATGSTLEGAHKLFSFDVVDVIKGDVDSQVQVKTSNNSASCGRNYNEGTSYLLYVHQTPDGSFGDLLCSRTKPLVGATEDLAALSNVRQTQPTPAGAPDQATEPPRVEPDPGSNEPPPVEPSKRGCATGGDVPPPWSLALLTIVGLVRRRR